jgi:hypothetical protein
VAYSELGSHVRRCIRGGVGVLRWSAVIASNHAVKRLRKGMPIVVLALGLVYCGAAHFHIQGVNTEIVKADQSAYIFYARQMSLTRYAYVGGRNQMPVFPFLITAVDRYGVSADDLFVRAKYLNVGLSLLVLVSVFFLLRRSLPELEAFTLTLITAFTVFVYRAGYAQAELLFYGLFFLSFLLALSLLAAPGWGMAALCGFTMGIAYLTKASVLPLLSALMFWGIVTVGAGIRRDTQWVEAVDDVADEKEHTRGSSRLRTLAVMALVAISFLVTVSPYIHTSKERFGHWFYNVNTSIYMWADSWEEVKQVMSGTGDREHWPDLPEHLLPSPRRYFAEHRADEIVSRIAGGIWTSELRHLIEMPFGYGKYLIFYSALALLAAARFRKEVSDVCFADGRWVQTGFVLSVVVGYVVAYAFYSPIVRGPRLVLALYLPAMFSIFYLLTRKEIASRHVCSVGSFAVGLRHLHALALAMLAFDIVFTLPRVITSTFAGA